MFTKQVLPPPTPTEPSHRTLNIFKNILVFTFTFVNGLWISQVRSRAWLSPETLLASGPRRSKRASLTHILNTPSGNGSVCGTMRTRGWLCFNHPQWERLLLLPPGLNTQLLDGLSALWIGITNSLTSPDVTGAVTWGPGLRGQRGVPFAGSQACRPVRCLFTVHVWACPQAWFRCKCPIGPFPSLTGQSAWVPRMLLLSQWVDP